MRRILLIDDTPEIAELLTFALRDRGYEVFASGYTAAVNELVLEQRADALVLDCSAFEMSESLFDSCGITRITPSFPSSSSVTRRRRLTRASVPGTPEESCWSRNRSPGRRSQERSTSYCNNKEKYNGLLSLRPQLK